MIEKILDIEWHMFSNTHNIGGKASCQDDKETFRIARSSQFEGWSEATLESYFNDLEEAKKEERNLLAEKYARMMKYTSPTQYSKIEHMLPQLSSEVTSLINKIAEIESEWQEKFSEKFPNIIGRGRPIRSSQDTPFSASFETYLRGELSTYSERTLKLYYEDILRSKSKQVNKSEIVYEIMMKKYGYKSLYEAERAIERNIV